MWKKFLTRFGSRSCVRKQCVEVMKPQVRPRLEPRALFDEMAKTYGIVHVISSLGFAFFWRRECAKAIDQKSSAILDVMSGSGEMVPILIRHIRSDARIRLVDFSRGMCEKAQKNSKRWRRQRLEIVNEDALSLSCPDEEFDAVTCSFGLKTLTMNEVDQFAAELWRVTKRNGTVSLLEFSVPRSRFLYPFFKLYVKHYVPLLGRILLGNPDNYRMLWEYTSEFESCRGVIQNFERVGFQTKFYSHFFGCATQIVAVKV